MSGSMTQHLRNLRFPDDIAWFSNFGGDFQQKIGDLSRQSARSGLKTIMQKSKVIFNSLPREQEFLTGGQLVE